MKGDLLAAHSDQAVSGTHTSEPWSVRTSMADPNYQHIRSEANDRIACTKIEANARRIVACVNACAGIDTDAFAEMPGGLVTGFLELIENAPAKMREMRAQRDELAAALRLMREEFANLPHSLAFSITHLPKIDAVLARADPAHAQKRIDP